MLRRPTRGAGRLVAATAALVLATPAAAEVDPAGNFTTSIPISVPPYFNITPRIALTYHGGSTGYAGAGWALDVGSVITRTSSTRGTPRFIAGTGPEADRFWLDGEELIPCAPGMASPSCTLGAAAGLSNLFATRIEHFERIQLDPAIGVWTVWGRDGTRRSYESKDGGVGYQLQLVRDAHGNQVVYRWRTGSPAVLETIAYGATLLGAGTKILFSDEPRADIREASTGAGTRARFDRRLHDIIVMNHAGVLRAYRLNYRPSQETGASLLYWIEQFGTDTTVDLEHRTITAPGTPLPPIVFGAASATSRGTWQPVTEIDSAALLDVSAPPATPLPPHYVPGTDEISNLGPGPATMPPHGAVVGDFDGNRRNEVLSWRITQGCKTLTARVRLSTSSGVGPVIASSVIGTQLGNACTASTYVADVDGDGRDDLIVMADNELRVALAGPDGRFASGGVTTLSDKNPQCATGDIDGDGRADLICQHVAGRSVRGYRATPCSTGICWQQFDTQPPNLASFDNVQLAVADLDGDGLGDLIVRHPEGGSSRISVGLSHGNGMFAWDEYWLADGGRSHSKLYTPDLDGDGLTDIAVTDGPTVYAMQSRKGPARFATPAPYASALLDPSFADLDGDGRADLFGTSIDNNNTLRYQLAHPGGGFEPPIDTDADCHKWGYDPEHGPFYMASDLDGDGLADAICVEEETSEVDEGPPLTGTYQITDVRSQPRGADRHRWKRADTDGDGEAELVYVAFENPGYTVTMISSRTQSKRTLAVMNGAGLAGLTEPDTARWLAMEVGSPSGPADGKADLVLVEPAGQPGAVRITTLFGASDGGLATTQSVVTIGNPGDGITTPLDGVDAPGWMPVDLDGDGMTDLVRFRPNLHGSGVIVDSLRAAGAGTFTNSTAVYFGAGSAGPLTERTARWFQPTDVDGDGRTDFVHVAQLPGSPGAIRVLRALASGGFEEMPMSTVPAVIDTASWRPIDLDGDGNVDLVHLTPSSDAGHSCVTIHTLTGDGRGGFGLATSSAVCVDTSTATATALRHLLDDVRNISSVDLDGDGQPELVHVTHQHATQADSTLVISTLQRDSTGVWSIEIATADANGQAFTTPGVNDLGDSWNWTPNVDSATGFAGFSYLFPNKARSLWWTRARDELTSVDNSLGLSSTIARGPATGQRGYVPAGMVPRVVTRVAIADSISLTSDAIDHAYDGPRWSDRDRRLIGFAARTATDARSSTLDAFNLDDRCGALVTDRTIFHGTIETRFSHVSTQYEPIADSPPFRCQVKRTTREEIEPGHGGRTAEQHDFFHDDLGNIDQTVTTAYGARPTRVRTPFKAAAGFYVLDRPMSRVTEEQLPDGEWVTLSNQTYYYDHASDPRPPMLGDLTKIETLDNTRDEVLTTVMDYDGYGTLTRTTTPGGKLITILPNDVYPWLPHQQCTSGGGETLCTTTWWDYVLGMPAASADTNSAITLTLYDPLGRVAEVRTPESTTRTRYLDTSTSRQRVRTELLDGSTDGLYSDAYYDGTGRTYKTVRKGGLTTDTQYSDRTQRPWKTSDPYNAKWDRNPGYTTFTYDAVGRVATVTHPDGTHVDTGYQLGQATVTDEVGAITRRRFDGLGRAVEVDEVHNGTSATTHYAYDGAGRLLTIVDALGHHSSTLYSTAGRVIATTDPDRGQRSFLYEPDGELWIESDDLENHIMFEHDGLGRTIHRTDTGESGVDRDITWTYDRATSHGASKGRLIAVYDWQDTATESSELWYDQAGRTTRIRRCVAQTCLDEDQSFDVAGRLQSTTYPGASGSTTSSDAEQVIYTYDSLSRLTGVGPYATLEYQPDGRLRSVGYHNGVVTAFAYDPQRHWLTNLDIDGASGALLHIAYDRHDATGRIRHQLAAGEQPTDLAYTYDDLGRLTDVGSGDPARREHIDYDAIGRVIATTRTGAVHYTDPLHVHAPTDTAAGASRTYDRIGNATALSDPDGRTLTLLWRVDGHPAEIDARNGSSTFAYDPAGRRVAKQDSAGLTRYFGPDLEIDVKGRLVKYYSAGGMLLARNDGDVTFVHADVSHAIRLETDASGGLVNSYEYTSSGEPFRTAEALDHDIGFAEGRTDDQIDLITMGARVYDPKLGHFLSADSIIPSLGRPQSLHRYSYVENDPINHWDPSGHAKLQVEVMMERKQQMRSLQAMADAGVDCTAFGSQCEAWMTGTSATAAGRRDFYLSSFDYVSVLERARAEQRRQIAKILAEAGTPAFIQRALEAQEQAYWDAEAERVGYDPLDTGSARFAGPPVCDVGTTTVLEQKQQVLDLANQDLDAAIAKVDSAYADVQHAYRKSINAKEETANLGLEASTGLWVFKIHKLVKAPSVFKAEWNEAASVNAAIKRLEAADDERVIALDTRNQAEADRNKELVRLRPQDASQYRTSFGPAHGRLTWWNYRPGGGDAWLSGE